MQIESIRISGYRSVSVCATYVASERRNDPAEIHWSSSVFEARLSVQKPFLHAIIGHNSSGKSNLLKALKDFFATTASKLSDNCFHGNDCQHPVVVEITFRGEINEASDWHQVNCVNGGESYQFTVARVWPDPATSRQTFIKQSDGSYRKAATADNDDLERLLPRFRLIDGESRFDRDSSPDKNDLISDLMDDLLATEQSNRSILYKIRKQYQSLCDLLERAEPPNAHAWREVEKMEHSISKGLGALTPAGPRVRFRFKDILPELQAIMLKSTIKVDDGVELDFREHGLGLQRTFILSVLSVWCQRLENQTIHRDYVFAVEEPELFLYPHAVRTLLSLLEGIADSHQVLFTSHSTDFVNRVPLSNVICIRRTGNQRALVQPDLSHLDSGRLTKVQRYLWEDRSDMLFARSVVLVEGQGEQYAFPAFARTIGVDLDRAGVSVVFVNGKGNFEVYHEILHAFNVPHVIFADGDGKRLQAEQNYLQLTPHVFVLDRDFEYELVSCLSQRSILSIVNACRERQGKPAFIALDSKPKTASSLKSNWWDKVDEALKSDILREYASEYALEKAELKKVLQSIAERAIQDGHLSADAQALRWADQLKKEGKPLVGRVAGELLKIHEVQKLTKMVYALQKAAELAN